MSYFRFWPIFSTAGSSSTGRKAVQRGHRVQARLALRRPDRQVPRLVVLPAERQADQLGPTRPDVRRFGVDRDALLPPQFGQKLVERLGRGDQPIRRLDLGAVLRDRAARQRVDLLGQASEAELGEQLRRAARGRTRRPGPASQSIGTSHVRVEPDELAAQQGPSRGPRSGSACRFAPETSSAWSSTASSVPYFGEQLGGDFGPDQRHARHVVRRIADQGLKIDDLLGPNPPGLLQLVPAENLVLADVVELHPIGDQLPAVLVAGDEEALPAELGRPPGRSSP